MIVMRALVVILIAIGVIFYVHGHAPTEIQMRDAFEHYLADQTARTVEFIQETGGPSAVERLFENSNASNRKQNPAMTARLTWTLTSPTG